MTSRPSSFVSLVRDADWLTAGRAVAWCRILAGAFALCGGAWVALSHGGLDAAGKPLGTDFLGFYAISTLLHGGNPALAYDAAAHAAAQRAVFGGAETGYFPFFYPPVFLLICWPLALLPYAASLSVWLAATGFAYWRVVSAFFARAGLARRAAVLPILVFPGVFVVLGHGQNAFLSTALFGGAILALRKQPVVAGLLFGALVFKPHLGVLIPVFLAASGAWAAFAAASVMAIVLCAASLAAFGPGVWLGFLATMPMARASLEQAMSGAEKMQSSFAAVILWGGPVWLAYAAQIAVSVIAVALLIYAIRKNPNSDANGPLLVTATLLVSPHIFDYDILLLAIPLAWTFAQAQRNGFLPWEKVALMFVFLLPLFSRTLAAQTLVPLGPVAIAALFALVLRRGLEATKQVRSNAPSPLGLNAA